MECSTGMEWWNGIVEWPHFSHLEGKEGSLGHIMCLKRFFHCAAHKFLSLGCNCYHFRQGRGGGGEIFEILAENWWLTLTQGFIEGGPSSPTTT